MKLISVNQITFIALGQEHKAYTLKDDLKEILSIIQLIAKTARITYVQKIKLDPKKTNLIELNSIKEWYESIENEYQDL